LKILPTFSDQEPSYEYKDTSYRSFWQVMGRESEDNNKRYINMVANEPINNDDNSAPI
jgi:hypothetical protein